MRAHAIVTKSRSIFVRRLLIVCLAVAAISMSTFTPVARAAGATPSIVNFSAVYAGNGVWMADGIIQAEHVSDVTLEFSGAHSETTVPDQYGCFTIFFAAPAGTVLYVSATDSSGTTNREVRLDDFEL